MTSGNHLPTWQAEIAALKAENRRLWEALRSSKTLNPQPEEIVFSWAGGLSGTRTSGPWHPPAACTLFIGTSGLGSASGGSTTVALKVDGVTVHTFILPAGATRYAEQFREHVDFGSAVQITVTGSGGSNFTFAVGFVRDRVTR